MEVASAGMSNGVPAPAQASFVDSAALIQYLVDVLQATLGALKTELESTGSLLSEAKYSETVQRCTRFASESQVALYVQKDLVASEGTNAAEDGEASSVQYAYNLSAEISSSSTTVASVAFIKRPAPIDPTLPISSQVQVINLPGPASLNNAQAQQGASLSPYEVLHLLVHHALSPYFEANTRNQDAATGLKPRTDTEVKTGVPGTKKKFAELELGLLHLQQNVEIPALNLPLHEVVQAALVEAETRGIKPSVELIPSNVLESSAFINSIQNNVNAWIRSIQTITKMSRDADSGSAALR